MKLAINYSEQANALVAEGRVSLDAFKCPDWPNLVEKVHKAYPVVVHFSLRAGPGDLANVDWKLIESLAQRTRTPYVNLHLDPTTEEYPNIPADEPAKGISHVIDRMLADVQTMTKRFGPERVIAENMPYRGRDGIVLRAGAEPEVINRIISKTGCGLLLDISHARISAHHLGMDAQEYMQRLPIESLKELHFTGLHRLNGGLQDHLPVLEEDWPVLEWVMERIRSGEWAKPWLLAFEYGGVGKKYEDRSDPEVIAAQIPRLAKIIKSA